MCLRDYQPGQGNSIFILRSYSLFGKLFPSIKKLPSSRFWKSLLLNKPIISNNYVSE